jgi:hypothetical protein
VAGIFVGQFAALAVLQPFLADLVAADVEVPDRRRYASEVLRRENVYDYSFLPDLQFTQGDIFDPFEILLVVRKKM